MAKDGDYGRELSDAGVSELDTEAYRLFADATEEGVVIHDFARILAANSHFARMFGYSEDQIEGAFPFAFLAPANPIRLKDAAANTADTYGETIGMRADGTRFPIEVIGRQVAYRGKSARIVRIRDLTQRKQAEEKLNATEERFRTTFEQAAIGIAHVDVDGTWLRANQRLCAMLGYARDELMRMTFQDLTHPEDLHADLELFNAVLAGQRDNYSMEKRYFHKDGSVISVNLTVAIVRLPNGAPSYFISMVEDITARKEMEEFLRRSQKMEVIGQLTSSIAHDFGNFLNVVKGNLQLLKLVQMDGKSSEYVSSALAGTELAEKLIRQLLSFSRHQEPEPEALDVDALIDGVSALLRRAVHNRIVLSFDLQAADFPLICDRVQLETALFNVVLNARDAIGDTDGLIAVATATVQRNGNDYVRLSVRDSGHGMAPDVLAHAMDPFFTTKAVGEGTGLGLSQVARCVAQMKGFVEIDTKPGAGTEVQLFLPQCRRASF